MTKDEKLLFVLLALTGVGAYLWLSQSGRTLATSAGVQLESGMLRLADLTDSTLQTIIDFENFSPVPYRDAGGWSIGYGYFMGTVPTIQNITRADAYNLLRDKATEAGNMVKRTIGQPMTQNQFDALTSLAYNIGVNGFAGSTVARLFNAGDVQGAADAFRLWNRSQGAVSQNLVNRRESERALFLT